MDKDKAVVNRATVEELLRRANNLAQDLHTLAPNFGWLHQASQDAMVCEESIGKALVCIINGRLEDV